MPDMREDAGDTEATSVLDPTDLAELESLALDEIADAEIPEIQREAQAWLIANNASDQRAVTVFAVALGIPAALTQTWWAVVLAGCVLAVLPFRWLADPHFKSGNIQKALLLANMGTWFLVFAMVLIIPETLPIAIQNVIGPMILAAAYLKRQVFRQLVPVSVAIAAVIAVVGYTSPGVGLDEVAPRWLFVTVLTFYLLANLLLVMSDLQESNRVRLRILHRAIVNNRELRAADQALRDSRRRLLVAADEERGRLEQNLHDGAQQRLVSLSLRLRLASELAEEGSAPTPEALLALQAEANEAIEELRELAQGVFPARLHELGLSRSLRALARRSPVEVHIVDEVPGQLDADAELALYFVCLEAIQNATKHGDADTTIDVLFSRTGDHLVVRITDDGPGFDPDSQSNSRGLINMEDRVGALGGELTVTSLFGEGTTVVATLPWAHLAHSDLAETAP